MNKCYNKYTKEADSGAMHGDNALDDVECESVEESEELQ